MKIFLHSDSVFLLDEYKKAQILYMDFILNWFITLYLFVCLQIIDLFMRRMKKSLLMSVIRDLSLIESFPN